MIDKLEFLLAIAREQNFRRAAESCGVAQPTLSAGIKSLEEQLGVLLVRQGRTPEGERVLEWARRLAGDARAMRDEVRSFRYGLTGALRLAVVPTAIPYSPVLTRRYAELHPGIRITVLSRSSNEILNQLNGLEVDAGLTYIGNETIGRLRAVPLYVERYRLIFGSSGPGTILPDGAAVGPSVTWAEAAAMPLCMLTGDMQNRRILDRLLEIAAWDHNPCMLETDSVMGLLAHVRTGRWATIVSEQVAFLLGNSESFHSVPIVGGNALFTVGLVIADRQPMALALRALLEVAEATKQVAKPVP